MALRVQTLNNFGGATLDVQFIISTPGRTIDRLFVLDYGDGTGQAIEALSPFAVNAQHFYSLAGEPLDAFASFAVLLEEQPGGIVNEQAALYFAPAETGGFARGGVAAVTNVMVGGLGADTLGGGVLYDRLDGNAGDDVLDGRAGDDVLNGGEGADRMIGRAGADRLDGNAAADLLNGGAGNDTLIGGLSFSAAPDGPDTLVGGAGDDSLFSYAGADRLFGGDGNDTMDGLGGNDMAFGGAGNDSIGGSFGGNDGDDRLYGEGGADTLVGGAGGDVLVGGTGSDLLVGGAGADRIRLDADGALDVVRFLVAGDGRDAVEGFVSGEDRLQLSFVASAAFVADDRPVATTGGPTLLFDTDNGRLSYDADGCW